jgi:hypothetical protein
VDLYIFTLILGAAGMAAMAFLGFTSSHSGGHGGHDTAGHEMHGTGGHTHTPGPGHDVGHAHNAGHLTHPDQAGRLHTHSPHVVADGWKYHVWSWLSPRVLFNVLVGFGATGMIVERLVGPVLAVPVAVLGGIGFELFVVRPIFNSLFRFGSEPAQTLEASIMSEGKAVTGFDANGNGLIALELGGEVVQVLGTLVPSERNAGVRIRAGDIVRIEEVDSVRNRCTVSRIGLGET